MTCDEAWAQVVEAEAKLMKVKRFPQLIYDEQVTALEGLVTALKDYIDVIENEVETLQEFKWRIFNEG